MQIRKTPLKDALIIEPKIWGDERGFFFESYNQRILAELATEIPQNFVQDNHSRSQKNILRGLHYQLNNPQGKLVRVVSGEVFDVIVDIRKSSETYGQWFGIHLSAINKTMLWIPEGFAHGFVVLSDWADFVYKTTNFYDPASERSIRWDDPTIGIQWPINSPPLLSSKDANGSFLEKVEVFA